MHFYAAWEVGYLRRAAESLNSALRKQLFEEQTSASRLETCCDGAEAAETDVCHAACKGVSCALDSCYKTSKVLETMVVLIALHTLDSLIRSLFRR